MRSSALRASMGPMTFSFLMMSFFFSGDQKKKKSNFSQSHRNSNWRKKIINKTKIRKNLFLVFLFLFFHLSPESNITKVLMPRAAEWHIHTLLVGVVEQFFHFFVVGFYEQKKKQTNKPKQGTTNNFSKRNLFTPQLAFFCWFVCQGLLDLKRIITHETCAHRERTAREREREECI